jgi:hypothetical protein
LRLAGVWTGIAGACLVVFCADALLFRTGWYPVEPDSTTGKVEYTLALEAARPKRDPHEVLVFGDSRMRFLARFANDETAPVGVAFGSCVVPGTTPRCWEYMARAVDAGGGRYDAVVVPLDSFADTDGRDELADFRLDLHHLAGLLGLRDLVEFPLSHRSLARRWQAFRGTLLKGAVYQRDIQAFLAAPAARLAKVAAYEEHYAEWSRDYLGEEGTLAGLEVDWVRRRIAFPPQLTDAVRANLSDVLLRPPSPQTGRTAVYRRTWLGKLVARYRGTRTRIVFMRLPRGPVVPPGSGAAAAGVIYELARANSHVVVLDEHLFDFLERPKFYADGLHLNHVGSSRLSRELARQIATRIGAHAF